MRKHYIAKGVSFRRGPAACPAEIAVLWVTQSPMALPGQSEIDSSVSSEARRGKVACARLPVPCSENKITPSSVQCMPVVTISLSMRKFPRDDGFDSESGPRSFSTVASTLAPCCKLLNWTYSSKNHSSSGRQVDVECSWSQNAENIDHRTRQSWIDCCMTAAVFDGSLA
jgi:hypothetical protein